VIKFNKVKTMSEVQELQFQEEAKDQTTPRLSLEQSLDELSLPQKERQMISQGFKSAEENQDFLLVSYLGDFWQQFRKPTPKEVVNLEQKLETLYQARKVNKRFDTQLEEKTEGLSQKEILLKKIARGTEQNERLKTGTAKLIAIVIPSYCAEMENLPKTLQSLQQQEFDGPVIVIVSNNNSPENNKVADVGKIGEEHGTNVATDSIPGNIASARRKGCDQAMININNLENLIIAGIDSDTIAKPGYLKEIRQVFKDESVVAWTDLIDFGENVSGEIKKVERWVNDKMKDTQRRTGACNMPGCTHAVRGDVYKAIGGHSLDYAGAEDINLSEKVYEYIKQKKGLEGQDLQMRLSETKSTITSPRKFLDDKGKFSKEKQRAILDQWAEFEREAARTKEISGNTARSRQFRERLALIRNIFSTKGIRVITEELVGRRKLDADYQRTVNLPKVRNAILKETKEKRDAFNTTISREIAELQQAHPNLEINLDNNFYLMGVIYKDEEREMTVILRRSINSDGSFKYSAVQIERKFSNNDQLETHRVFSWAEIDPSNDDCLTQVYWADQNPYFHPDDQYPRVTSFLFNTLFDLLNKVPTGQVDVEIRPHPTSLELSEKSRARLATLSKGLGSQNIGMVKQILTELETI